MISREKCLEMATASGAKPLCAEADIEFVEALINRAYAEGQRDMQGRADEIEKLRAALTICAAQFDKYAEIHKAKMEDHAEGTPYYDDAESKWHRNQLLAFNAREALE